MSIVAQKKPPLSETHPELAKQWSSQNVLKANEVTAGSGKRARWVGVCSHKWEARIADRAAGSGCPVCVNRVIIPEINSLAVVNPMLALEWSASNTLTPHEIAVSSNKKVWWVCNRGHEWYASPNNRSKFKGSGCPYCTGKKVFPGFNDLTTTHPDLSSQWSVRNTLTPQNTTAGSDKKVWWECEEGHEWSAQIKNRTNGGGCPFCTSRKILIGYNDLATTRPDLVLEWAPYNPFSPKSVMQFSNTKIWWICVKGHEWEATVSSRHRSGCPICAQSSVSRVEKQLLEFLSSYQVQPQHIIFYAGGKKRMYVDGFFESAGAEFVVEYDGAYWHATTFQKDINKTNILLNKDYYVIRVRENTTQHPLDLLPIESDNLLQLKFNYTADYRNLPALVDQIKTFVEQQ